MVGKKLGRKLGKPVKLKTPQAVRLDFKRQEATGAYGDQLRGRVWYRRSAYQGKQARTAEAKEKYIRGVLIKPTYHKGSKGTAGMAVAQGARIAKWKVQSSKLAKKARSSRYNIKEALKGNTSALKGTLAGKFMVRVKKIIKQNEARRAPRGPRFASGVRAPVRRRQR